MRWLIRVHRYLGIGVGWLLLLWCLSGVAMVYVHYPALTAAQRIAHLQRLSPRQCCVMTDADLADDARFRSIRAEMLAGRPVLRLRPASGAPRLIDLVTGRPALADGVGPATAVQFSRTVPAARTPRLLGTVDYDQWTVSGEFDRARPLQRFALGDPAGTEVYVSARTGEAVQSTTATQRFWNWFGPIPHWLYFARLRHAPQTWTQVVIWSAVAGSLLSLMGVIVGVAQWRSLRAGRLPAYRGLEFWHHVLGLAFGLCVLSWAVSGLLSMNPWGLLEGRDELPALQALYPQSLSGRDVKRVVQALPRAFARPGAASVEAAAFLDRVYLVVTTAGGERVRLDDTGEAAPLRATELAAVGRILGQGGAPVAIESLGDGDDYYFARSGQAVTLPVYRAVLDDPERTRLYLDPVTAAPIELLAAGDRGYRWLFEGVHTLDVARALHTGPRRAALLLALLAGATLVCATGVWRGLRRVIRGSPSRDEGSRR